MLIFVHGGIPGLTPYASGPHIWGRALELFKAEHKVLALELRGKSVEAQIEETSAALSDNGADDGVHLIGHDLGGLVALLAAADAPKRVRSVTAVSSVAAAPTGDSVVNLTFAHPPRPLWSRASQAWALERISYSHLHIDTALLDACERAAKAHPQETPDDFQPGVMAAKARLFELARERGYPVPVQVIWGTDDPLGTFDQGLWLFRLLAQKQRVAQFHAINRAGALPFREAPEAFHQIVSAFVEGLRDE
jgi:pimeloyl-ACP methyl ester carboxylesterase